MNGGVAFPFLLFGAFAVLAIVMAVYGISVARKRRELLAAWANKAGLTFDEGRDGRFRDRFPAFSVLRSGEQNRYAYNIMTGAWRDRPLTAFDYHYETTSTDSKGNRHTTSHTLSAVILGSGIVLDTLSIRPEGLLDRLGSLLGFEDINFESAEFSRRFRVGAERRKWAFDVLHPRAIEFLLAQPPFSLQMDRAQVIVWNGRVWSPDDLLRHIAIAEGLLDRLPDYVKRQQADVNAGGTPS